MKPKLVAFDVDGTLAGADHQVSAYTRQVLAQLPGLGVAGVVITGRAERSALGTARDSGLTSPVVCCNGALVTDPVSGERLWVKAMDPVAAHDIVAAIRRHGLHPVVWTADAIYASEESVGSQLIGHLNQVEIQFGPLEAIIDGQPVVKIMGGGPAEDLDRACPPLEEEVGLERSMDRLTEVSAPGASKGDAMAFLLQHLGVDGKDGWGFGDGDNDRGWLALMGRVLVPANGYERTLAMADEVIASNAEDGVAKYLAQHLLG
ncbi:MAG: Cof-type HAD-IIB family hydrolase [Propionibacteriaceae bacterium]|jgi:Cof subfamily protein (haloacid dehalogenase superfamily)|nr:Cof-type HAD-IIB family hydrolase [Propionibacteriaceae bacterium]